MSTMRQQDLTERQQDIYRFLRTHTIEYGYQPNLREIGERFGIKSTNGVSCHLRVLAKKGYIEMTGRARSIKFLK